MLYWGKKKPHSDNRKPKSSNLPACIGSPQHLVVTGERWRRLGPSEAYRMGEAISIWSERMTPLRTCSRASLHSQPKAAVLEAHLLTAPNTMFLACVHLSQGKLLGLGLHRESDGCGWEKTVVSGEGEGRGYRHTGKLVCVLKLVLMLGSVEKLLRDQGCFA